MTVQSAKDLHDLLTDLSGKFGIHASSANSIRTNVDGQINHVVSEAGQWLAHELGSLQSDWQSFGRMLMDIESWFNHNGPKLVTVAAQALELSTEVLAAGGIPIGVGVGIWNGVGLFGNSLAGKGLRAINTAEGIKDLPEHVAEVLDHGKHLKVIGGDIESTLSHGKNGLEHAITHTLGDDRGASLISKGKYLKGAGNVLSVAGIAVDAHDAGSAFSDHHYREGASSTLDGVASALKMGKVTYPEGVVVSIIKSDVDAYPKSLSGIPSPFSHSNWNNDYKLLPRELWKDVTTTALGDLL